MDNKYFPTVPNWGLESRKRSGTKVPRTQSGWDRPETQASRPPPTPVCSPSMVSTHLCEGDFLYLCSHTPPHPAPPPDTSISATQDSRSPCYATVLHQCWKREGTEEDPAGLKTCQVTPCLVIRGSFCPQDEVLPPAKAQSPAPATLSCLSSFSSRPPSQISVYPLPYQGYTYSSFLGDLLCPLFPWCHAWSSHSTPCFPYHSTYNFVTAVFLIFLIH